MAKVIFIGSDRTIFKEGSLSRMRMIDYGSLFEELHIIVFSKRKANYGLKVNGEKIAQNVWLYPTSSWSKYFYPFDASKIAQKIIKNKKSDNWVISAQDPFETGLSAWWAVRKTKAKFHIQIHTDFLSSFFLGQSFLNRIRLFLAKIILPKANAIRVVSKRIKDSLDTIINRTESEKSSKIKLLPIFNQKPDIKNIIPFDFKYDHPNWSFVIFCACRLEKEKNLILALETLKLVQKKYPHVGLVLAGSGSQKEYLKKLSNKMNLSQSVDFIGWHDNLAEFFLGSGVFLQTSNFEGFGNSAMEAVWFGVPVVTTDVGSAGWLLKNGENSVVCPVGDAKCLAKGIVNIIEDNQLRQNFIINSRTVFESKLARNKEEYLQEFKKSIESVS